MKKRIRIKRQARNEPIRRASMAGALVINWTYYVHKNGPRMRRGHAVQIMRLRPRFNICTFL